MPKSARTRLAVPLDREEILAGLRLPLPKAARGLVPIEHWYASPEHELDAMIWSGRYAVAVVGRHLAAGAGWHPLADGTLRVSDLFIHPRHADLGLLPPLMDRIRRTVQALDRKAEPASALAA